MLIEILSNGINTNVKIDGVEQKDVKAIKFEHDADETATIGIEYYVAD
ncbi:hypothetical protein [Clostridium sporogenes]|nr:hypothetical protein [Clostridium sporogenes]KRU46296.1 hypothetical protein VT94_04700 [Clostridium sporogenes]MBY7064371.1 hypothetical protein [Clostridium sporogenes]MBY7071371.1 hypothetical protein [Clostridium sporogenes]MCW6064802.1 hypothetical protein [Clostridium sporogenes]OQP89698.1 hypothetical protein VT93_0201050 [Clostridium sporogenes]